MPDPAGLISPLDSDDAQCDGLASMSLHLSSPQEVLDVGIEGIKVVGYPRDLGQVVECTGQTLWRGGELLARWIEERQIEFGRCLEVGAGLGLCSLVAERCSRGGVVVATDGDDLAVDSLRRNIALNDSKVFVRKLRWGDVEAGKSILDEFGGQFDYVLAADVAYDENAIDFLVSTLAQMLSQAGTLALSFTHRGVSLDTVVQAAFKAGLVVVEEVRLPNAEKRRPDSNDDSLLLMSWRQEC